MNINKFLKKVLIFGIIGMFFTSIGAITIIGTGINKNQSSSEETNLYSSENGATWMKIIGGTDYDIGSSIQQTDDNGFIIVGSTKSYGVGDVDIWLIKIDEMGDEEWNVTFGASNKDYGKDVKQTTDGGYIIVGKYDGGRLLKTDAYGKLEWNKIFQNWALYRVHQTSDEGFIIIGRVYSSPSQDHDILLLKVDKVGNEMWNKSYGGSGYEAGFSIAQTSDDGYILTGYNYLIKTDGNGLDEWILEIGFEGLDVLQNSDGGYTVIGYKGDWPRDMTGRMIITDSDGNILNSRTYKGIFTSYLPRSIYQTSDDGYIMTGEIDSEMPFSPLHLNLWLAKTDKSGKLVWSKKYGGQEYDFGTKVQETIDGCYIVVGGTNSYGPGSVDTWLLKTDENGKIHSSCNYQHSNNLFNNIFERFNNNFPILQKILLFLTI